MNFVFQARSRVAVITAVVLTALLVGGGALPASAEEPTEPGLETSEETPVEPVESEEEAPVESTEPDEGETPIGEEESVESTDPEGEQETPAEDPEAVPPATPVAPPSEPETMGAAAVEVIAPQLRDYVFHAPLAPADLMAGTGYGEIDLAVTQLVLEARTVEVNGVPETDYYPVIDPAVFHADWALEMETSSGVVVDDWRMFGAFSVYATEVGNFEITWRLRSLTDPTVVSNDATIKGIVHPTGTAADWLWTAETVDTETPHEIWPGGRNSYINDENREPRFFQPPIATTWPVSVGHGSFSQASIMTYVNEGLGVIYNPDLGTGQGSGGLMCVACGTSGSAGQLYSTPTALTGIDLVSRFPELSFTGDFAIIGADSASGALSVPGGSGNLLDGHYWSPGGFTATPTPTGVQVQWTDASWGNAVMLKVAALLTDGTQTSFQVIIEVIPEGLRTGDLERSVPVDTPLFVSTDELLAAVEFSGLAPTAKTARAVALPDSVTEVSGGYLFEGSPTPDLVSFEFVGEETISTQGGTSVPALSTGEVRIHVLGFTDDGPPATGDPESGTPVREVPSRVDTGDGSLAPFFPLSLLVLALGAAGGAVARRFGLSQ